MQNNTQTHHDPTVLEPPRDANGVAILPGYRKPFNSESGRAAAFKSREALAPARTLLTALKLNSRELQATLANYRRAIRRHTAASCAATDASAALKHAKAAEVYHNLEQSLLGHSTTKSKRGSTKHLAHVSPMANVEPIASQKVSPLVNHSCSSEIHSVTPVSPSETTIQSQ